MNFITIFIEHFYTHSKDLNEIKYDRFADFEDMSCEIIYGKAPLPIEEDPALQQPCFASLCKKPWTPVRILCFRILMHWLILHLFSKSLEVSRGFDNHI